MQNQQRPLYVRDILSILENFAPLSLQESYDNAGLICGNPEAEIHSVLLSTDITEEVINEAVQGGHDLLISHHPLTIQGLKNLRPDSYVKRCLIKAISTPHIPIWMPYYTVSAAEWPTNWDYKTGKSCNRAVNYSACASTRLFQRQKK